MTMTSVPAAMAVMAPWPLAAVGSSKSAENRRVDEESIRRDRIRFGPIEEKP